jgi:hypothetical protein
MDKELDKLQKIKPVEAPPFLLTRIKARLHAPDTAPGTWKWVFAAIALVLLVGNLTVLLNSNNNRRETPDVGAVVNALHLSSSNELYHE